jgi:hypothetical protein
LHTVFHIKRKSLTDAIIYGVCLALYTQRLEKEKVLDVSEQLQNDEYLKYQIQLYVNGLKTMEGFRYKKVSLDEYKELSILMLDKECKEATLTLLEDFGYRLNETVLEYPIGYEPEDLEEWCVEGIIMRIPFYAKTEKGEAHVATLHLETREGNIVFDTDNDVESCFEGYDFRPGRPAIHSTWFDRDSKLRPKIITNEWETNDLNLLEAIKHSGEMFVEMKGPDMRIRY